MQIPDAQSVAVSQIAPAVPAPADDLQIKVASWVREP